MTRAWLLLAAALALPACSLSASAGASGSMSIGPTADPASRPTLGWWPARERVFEEDGSWVLALVLDTGDQPAPTSKLPLRVELDMRTFYEEQDVGGQMVTRAYPVQDAFTHSVTQHVCFRSSRSESGRYMVPIVVDRSEGFRPGEYDVLVTRLDTGKKLAGSGRVTLLRR